VDINRVTRRQLLAGSGAAVAGAGGLSLAGMAGYAWPHDVAAAAVTTPMTPDATRGVLHFVTRPDLTPPAVTISHYGHAASSHATDPPYVILTPSGYPRTGPGVPGLMILTRAGRLVWYSPNTGFPARTGSGRVDLKVQTYRGKSVLTWWEGKIIVGYGEGKAVIADSSYRTIATVNAGNGLQADLHEFVITPQNTALITAFRPMQTNLSALGGPARGIALSGTVQEIDIASGKVLFQWNSLDHVPVTDTYVPFAGGTKAAPFDYFHINSIAIAPDGGLLISARNTGTIYKVDRPSGKLAWKLGGKRSSFHMGPGAAFYYQHHVTPQSGGALSLFDDGGSPAVESQSRGILLDLDTSAMRATLKHSYTHPARLQAANQGSMQVLADGRVFVGWGNLPYFSEFAANGTLLTDGQFPVGDQSYRAFLANWAGHPTDKPAVVAHVNPAGGSTVYASWNGATELSSWTVLAGQAISTLKQAGSQRVGGFETAITVNRTGPYFAAIANDAAGRAIGRSATVRLTS
jgi:Arylsulfotransferase (ASST)